MANTDDDDLDQWMDTLAGRKPASGAGQADPQAQALRAAVSRHAARIAPPPAAEADAKRAEDHAWQRLAFRLRREGPTGRTSVWARPWLPAAMVATLILGIGVNIYWGGSNDASFAVSYTEAPQYRSGIVVIDVTAARPVPSAQRLANAAQRFNASPRVYVFGGKAVLDLEVPADMVASLKKEFERNEVPTTKLQAGLVRVVFATSP